MPAPHSQPPQGRTACYPVLQTRQLRGTKCLGQSLSSGEKMGKNTRNQSPDGLVPSCLSHLPSLYPHSPHLYSPIHLWAEERRGQQAEGGADTPAALGEKGQAPVPALVPGKGAKAPFVG